MKHLRRQQKLQPLWQGPFEVVGVDRPDYVVLKGGRRYKIHGALLKAWRGDEEADDSSGGEGVGDDPDPLTVEVEDPNVVGDELTVNAADVELVDTHITEDTDGTDARLDTSDHPAPEGRGDRGDALGFLPAATRSGRHVTRNRRYQ